VVANASELEQPGLIAVNANWIERPSSEVFTASCRIRYRHTPAPCRVILRFDSCFEVQFDQPQTSVTPGQAAVLYDGDRVLGGGWIE